MDRPTLQMIDACRPGSADIELPEMAPLGEQLADPELRRRYERTQQLDSRLSRAFAEVEVPAGLHERILAAINGESEGRRTTGEDEASRKSEARNPKQQRAGDARPEAAVAGNPTVAARRRTRRRWAMSIAAVAAGLLLLATGYVLWPRHASLSYDDLLNQSTDWYKQLQEHPAWQPLPPHEMVRDFPLSDAVRARPRRWADVSSLVGEAACAYDLVAPNGRRAALFVIESDKPIAPSTPSPRPGSSTGGLMIGCWQSGNLVYVLVVDGDEQTYRSLIDDSGPPLADAAPEPRNLSLACQFD